MSSEVLVTLSGDSAKIPPAMGHALKRGKRHLELNLFIEFKCITFQKVSQLQLPPVTFQWN